VPDLDEVLRWHGEPVKALLLPTAAFLTNKRGYPTLTKAHQELLTRFFQMGVQVRLCSCHVIINLLLASLTAVQARLTGPVLISCERTLETLDSRAPSNHILPSARGTTVSFQQLTREPEHLKKRCRWCCLGRAGTACPQAGSSAPYLGTPSHRRAASRRSAKPAQQAAALF
jgi:hypothetical protein